MGGVAISEGRFIERLYGIFFLLFVFSSVCSESISLSERMAQKSALVLFMLFGCDSPSQRYARGNWWCG